MNFTEQQLSVRDAILVEGMSRREAARVYLGSSSRESTIRGWIKDGLLGDNVDTTPVEEDLTDLTQQELDLLCENPDWSVSNLAKRLRAAQRSNNQLRKVQRELFDDKYINFEEVLSVYSKLEKTNNTIKVSSPSNDNSGLVMEVLFNDWQVSKRMSYYNTEVAIARVEEYVRQILVAYENKVNDGYTFDKIVIVLNGDIIESNKHDDSILASDRSPAEQLAIAIEVLSSKFLQPLLNLGVKTDVIGITGNHDWNGHGMMAYEAGKHQLSYPMYRAIQMILEAKGYKHVEFIIPSGWFYVYELLGKNVLYEHGVGVASSEAAMRKRGQQRGQQVEKHIHYVRFADKHHSQRHHNDTVVLAGAFFGRCDDDGSGAEYSAAMGYSAEPSQLTFFHQKRDKNDYRNTIIDSLEVQLGHINHKTVE